MYNVLISRRHGIPVRSAIILLRNAADGPEMTGVYEQRLPSGAVNLHFRYEVVRVWEHPVEQFLEGGIGILPLAPLAKVTKKELPAVVERMAERLRVEVEPAEAEKLWTATYILMGLKYTGEMAGELLRGVRNMRESATYQLILEEGRSEGRSRGLEEGRSRCLEEGRLEEARQTLLLLGRKRFGEPSAAILTRISKIHQLDRIHQLIVAVLDAQDWRSLLRGS